MGTIKNIILTNYLFDYDEEKLSGLIIDKGYYFEGIVTGGFDEQFVFGFKDSDDIRVISCFDNDFELPKLYIATREFEDDQSYFGDLSVKNAGVEIPIGECKVFVNKGNDKDDLDKYVESYLEATIEEKKSLLGEKGRLLYEEFLAEKTDKIEFIKK